MSSAKRKFAESLNEFKFQCIGDAETDDEICIGKQLLFSFFFPSLNIHVFRIFILTYIQ